MTSPPPEPDRLDMADKSAMWPSASANSFRQEDLVPEHANNQQDRTSILKLTTDSETTMVSTDPSRNTTTASQSSPMPGAPVSTDVKHTTNEHGSESDSTDEDGGFEPIKGAKSNPPISPDAEPALSRKITENDLIRVLSRRRTNASGGADSVTTADDEEQAEIERLMSRMFGKTRQENSEDEKTRHVGLVFKNLTVKGLGLGAALQGTLSDPFMSLPRFFKSLASNGTKGATGKTPVRTILDDFTGSVRPGEMLLVLGRPGSGCSTFLKVLANQRAGYVSVDGDVSYGGTDAKTMEKNYRGEIVYNPEDDLHYATLSVKRTLAFALKTRTPGKASRNVGESRADYVKEFLRVVSKLFWIEHTSSYPSSNQSLWKC